MAFTYTASSSILSALCGKSQYCGLLSTCYIGLSSSTPTKDGKNFTEPPASSGYQRVLLGNYNQSTSILMGNPSEGQITNDKIIFFPEATVSWNTLTHFGLWSAPTGGTLYLFGALTTPITVAANYVPIFRAGNFTLKLT